MIAATGTNEAYRLDTESGEISQIRDGALVSLTATKTNLTVWPQQTLLGMTNAYLWLNTKHYGGQAVLLLRVGPYSTTLWDKLGERHLWILFWDWDGMPVMECSVGRDELHLGLDKTMWSYRSEKCSGDMYDRISSWTTGWK